MYTSNIQPRPQGFSVNKWVGRPNHLLREKPWGRRLAISLVYHKKVYVVTCCLNYFFLKEQFKPTGH